MTKFFAPKSHPRYLSNFYRDLLVDGVKQRITSTHGLIAQGRGETFDYLLGEKTFDFATSAIAAAASLLITSSRPIISVNGNSAILSAKELITLSILLNVPLEINLFHRSLLRERKIADYLKKKGAKKILLPDNSKISGLTSNRRFVNAQGQHIADVIFVPLEDGDRTEYLIAQGKKVISSDLNPLSRSAQKATITIVDNIVRALPTLIQTIKKMQKKERKYLIKIINGYNNRKILNESIKHINSRLKQLTYDA